MKTTDSTTQVGWLNLLAWSETYIGAHWLIENKLPEKQHQTEPVDEALSQLVLIASHQLIEICLFSCIQQYLEQQNKWNDILAHTVRKLNFNEAFNKWPKLITGIPFPKNQQPFTSARELTTRRNATVHSESALTTLEMARSSLFTAVEVSRAVSEHFGNEKFGYEQVLKKYPTQTANLFCATMYPENKTKQR